MTSTLPNYKQLQKDLYPNIVEYDFLRHYFTERFTKNNDHLLKNGGIGKRIGINFGQEKELISVDIKPTKDIVERYGDEFCNEALSHYGKDYWLVAIWLAMYKDSTGNKLAREILRAFIKTCICCTSRELIASSVDDITKKSIKRLLPDKINFYNMVFSSSEIYKNMRIQYREQLKARSQEQNVRQIDNSLKLSTQLEEPHLKDIFADAGLSDYTELVTLSSHYASNEELKTITRALAIFINNVSGKRKLRKEISELIKRKEE
ncbi:hypothetical protein [Pseudoalteromonas byunsanensis]|uniref:Uncharacterized protein n=1 Tax=Pseudoalteromonas byunsanensis TaxID=327939 RepID=A0A1S1N7N6_9GAMM|nr:hypothetical protein [Pseudoalteromonas byunsanensis]OHU95502.1 hypothetical protein BIW53_09730 [Pseudoalteromonas byunsanensis]